MFIHTLRSHSLPIKSLFQVLKIIHLVFCAGPAGPKAFFLKVKPCNTTGRLHDLMQRGSESEKVIKKYLLKQSNKEMFLKSIPELAHNLRNLHHLSESHQKNHLFLQRNFSRCPLHQPLVQMDFHHQMGCHLL